jgi:hypothetical protein
MQTTAYPVRLVLIIRQLPRAPLVKSSGTPGYAAATAAALSYIQRAACVGHLDALAPD